MLQQQIFDLTTDSITTAKGLTPLGDTIVMIDNAGMLYRYQSAGGVDIPLTAGGGLIALQQGLVLQVTTDTTLTKEQCDAYKFVYVLAAPADANDITITNEANVRGNCEIMVIYDGTSTTSGDVIVNLNSFQSQGTQTLTGPGQYCSHRRTNSLGDANFWTLTNRDLIGIQSQIDTNATNIQTNTDDIGDLDVRVTALENEPPNDRIQNDDITAIALTNPDGSFISVTNDQYAHFRNGGTDTWTQDLGTFARSDGPVDDATSVPTNVFLTAGQLPSLDPTSPPVAVGESTITCTSISSNAFQGRTNSNFSGNVYQDVNSALSEITWTVTGLRGGATIYFKFDVANNAGSGQIRTGTATITHDGDTTTENWSAPFDITPGPATISFSKTIPESITDTTATCTFTVPSSTINVLMSNIEIDVEQFWGNSVVQNTGVLFDRQARTIAAYRDEPFEGVISDVPDNSVLAVDENGANSYRKKLTIGGTDVLTSMGDKIIQRFNITSGANWYRIATAQPTAKFIRRFEGFTTDGSHSENFSMEVGVRARIQGVGGGISNNQYIPRMIYQQLGAFSFFGGTTSDSVVRAMRFVQEGPSSANNVIHVDLQLWQDSSSSPVELYWDSPLSDNQDNLVVNHGTDIVVNPVITGFTINEYQLREYTQRNGNAFGVEFNRGSADEQWRTNTDGNLNITAPFIGT